MINETVKVNVSGVGTSMTNEEANEISEKLTNWTFEPFVQKELTK